MSSCGTSEQAQPTQSSEQASTTSAVFNPDAYDSWASEIADGPVWIAPGFVSEQLDADQGHASALPLATIDGDPSCSQPGAIKSSPVSEVRLYTATRDPNQINEVPQSQIKWITTVDGNATSSVSKNGVTTQCVEFSRSEDDFGLGEVPDKAAFPQGDGTWRKTVIATEYDHGLNEALAANGELNQNQ